MSILKKILYSLLIITVIAWLIIHFFSPTTYNPKGELQVSRIIVINDSVSSVFQYMGNSDNAKKWSVYVNHITLLNGEDGKEKCTRRCFKEADESGIQWDEEILELIPNQKRVLSIYNGKNFPIYSEYLLTEQNYENIDGKCKLTLQLSLKEKQSIFENLKFKFASFVVSNVFEGNLNNIKKDIEKQ
jgi:hypothetical protein